MRLLFINSSLTDGGSERAMVLVANQMVEFGHDVSMILIRDKERTYDCHPGIDLIQLRYTSSSKTSMLVKRLRLMRWHAKSLKPDCIVSFMWDVNVMTLLSTMGLGIRTVVSERAFPASSNRTPVLRQLEALAYNLTDAIVYQTEGARVFCPKGLSSKSLVIPNVVAQPEIMPFDGIRANVVVSVGRLVEQKNYPMLLNAFALFSSCHSDYVLRIFGEGRQRESLMALAVDLGIGGKIEFPGYIEDVPSQINNAAMFVLSSDFEGISNAMAEAMALGLPTICTDCPVGGAAMMIDDGENGLLVPVGDSIALAEAMGRVADDPQLAQRLSKQARKVVDRFSSKSIGRMWEKAMYGR